MVRIIHQTNAHTTVLRARVHLLLHNRSSKQSFLIEIDIRIVYQLDACLHLSECDGWLHSSAGDEAGGLVLRATRLAAAGADRHVLQHCCVAVVCSQRETLS